MTGRRLVIGVGNPDRGDDDAGRLAARLLRDQLDSDVEVLEHDGEVSSLLELLAESDMAYIIDAAASDSAPGAIHRFDARDGPLPRSLLALSTHGFGPAEAIELARALDRLPATCMVYAVEGETFAIHQPVSDSVDEAVRQLVREVAARLNGPANPWPPGRWQ